MMRLAALVFAAMIVVRSAFSAEPPKPRPDLTVETLPLRTALHHDPLLDAPLEQLLTKYRDARRMDDLLDLYRAHLAQFPGDAGATTVLVRLLAATDNSAAQREALAAVERFPRSAALHFVYSEILRKQQNPRGLDALDRAIDLEKLPRRKLEYIDALLPAAAVGDRPDLTRKHLAILASLADTPERRLDVARRMNKYKRYSAALELLAKGEKAAAPEAMVGLELEAAAAEAGLERFEAAATRLDRLLARLTADYWQRGEIVDRRMALVRTQSERDAIITRARQEAAAHPRDEAASLGLAQVLSALELRREALAALIEAGARLPKSEAIEKRTLELFDLLRDDAGREGYLARRVREQPGRKDLALEHVKTLFALRRSDEARKELASIVRELPMPEQVALLLETARYLRRGNLLDDAAAQYGQVVEREPARLDVRREMAETCVALGDRSRLQELFSGLDARKAELENVLDLVPFMVRQGMYAQARTVLAQRMELEPENIDLRLMLLDVHRRSGNAREGARLLIETRRLADSGPRYHQWLDASVAFHKEFDSLETFLDGEQMRLDREGRPASGRGLERRLIYVAVAATGGRREAAAARLEEELSHDLPVEARVRIRRELIGLFEAGVKPDPKAPRHLAELAKEDPESADECNARLALWWLKSQRQDEAAKLIDAIDVTRIKDPPLLSGLMSLAGARSQFSVRLLERLAALNPADRTTWERWLSALAVQGDEARLSQAIRRLLAGVDKMPLSPETRKVLQAHLADSQWREICRRLSGGGSADLAAALPLLASAERLAGDDVQWLWITWMRAYVLARLDRRQACDETMTEFERVLARMHQAAGREAKRDGDPEESPEEDRSVQPRITFPDGLSVSLAQARAMLGDRPSNSAKQPFPPRQGPLPKFAMKWAFDTLRQTPVTVLKAASRQLLIGDRSGMLCAVDKTSGRLLWESSDILPPAATLPENYGFPLSQEQRFNDLVTPKLLIDGRRFYVSGIDAVSCRSLDDGRLLWQAAVGKVSGTPVTAGARIPAMVQMGLEQSRLLCFDPNSCTASSIDTATGKLVWQRTLSRPPVLGGSMGGHHHGQISFPSGGESLSGGQLLVWGAQTAILDTQSGDVRWSFQPWTVRKLPVRLVEDDAASETSVSPMAPLSASSYMPMGRRRRGGPYGAVAGPAMVNYLQPQEPGNMPTGETCLVAPAVAWAAQAEHQFLSWGALVGTHLLLFNENSLHVTRTDLPFSSSAFAIDGTWIGLSGDMACLLSSRCLTVLDIRPEGVAGRRCALGSFSANQAILDGPAVYLLGPEGIRCVKLGTCEDVFETVPWPVGAMPESTAASTAAGTAPITPYMGYPYAARAYSGYAYPRNNQQQDADSPWLCNLGCVESGVLYTVSSPGRVVAIVEGAGPATGEKNSHGK